MTSLSSRDDKVVHHAELEEQEHNHELFGLGDESSEARIALVHISKGNLIGLLFRSACLHLYNYMYLVNNSIMQLICLQMRRLQVKIILNEVVTN